MKTTRLAFFDGGSISDSAERTLPENILLVKFGKNTFTKNGERGEFDFTEQDADAVIADFTERGRDLVIDFEHQSLSGEKAPAAGWIDKLVRTPEGILAKIKYWTKEAEEFLLKGQYRYFSPTLYFSRSGKRVSAIHSTALTNHPAMHMTPALVADDLHDSADDDASNETVISTQPPTKGTMMKELLEQLGLQAFSDAPQERQLEALSGRIAELKEAARSLEDFLALHDLRTLEEAGNKLVQLKDQKAADAVRQAFSDGKLAENMREWADSFARENLDAFKAWSQAAPRIIPDNADTSAPAETAPPDAADSEEAKILRLLGLTGKKLKKVSEKGNKE